MAIYNKEKCTDHLHHHPDPCCKMSPRLDGPTDDHFVLVPMMAQGHMIPMVDMALLLAARGVTVSLITTPANAARFKSTIERVAEAGLPVRFVALPFPSAEVGLPDGCENIDTVPKRESLESFVHACSLLREPLTSHLRAQSPSPTCIISDVFHPWTQQVAAEFGVPRFTFNGTGSFALLVRHIVSNQNLLDACSDVEDDDVPLVLPGLPYQVEITRAQAPGSFGGPAFARLRKRMLEVDAMADGVVVNSFDDLEPSCRECLEEIVGKKVWMIGPMSLANRDAGDVAARGNKSSIDQNSCLMWLDSMKTGSVIYASFGSLARTSYSQLVEIGHGLEASGSPFIWVVKEAAKSPELKVWLSGFEERVAGRGLVIEGWAPQVMILSHPAVGGFVTHCGWNSTLEGVSAGLPMITWPHFADQFVNERLIVDVLRIGVSSGVTKPEKWGVEDDGYSVLVKREKVKEAMRALMDGGDEGEERRKRAEELGKKARMAMEPGGLSYDNLTQLIKYSKEIHVKEE